MKKRYVYKIYPPRRDFYSTETGVEKRVMEDHVRYWQDLASEKNSVVYAPLFEPKGPFALALIEVNNSDEADMIGTHDPAVLYGGCTFGIIPMQIGRARSI